jgi:Mg-chelatase subunit ChlD
MLPGANAWGRWIKFSDDPEADWPSPWPDLHLTYDYVHEIPLDDLGPNAGDDFYVVIRTSPTIAAGDDFRIEIPPGGIQFSTYRDWDNYGLFSSSSAASLTSRVITAKTTTNAVLNNLTTQGMRIDATSDGVAIIGINLSDNNGTESLNSLKVHLKDVGVNNFDTTDLATLTNSQQSGIALYRDNTTAGTNGIFDPQDQFVSIGIPSWTADSFPYEWLATVVVSTPEPVPDTDTGSNAGSDFFLVIRTSNTITFGDDFTVAMTQADLNLTNNASTTSVETYTITANVPTVLNNLVSSGQRIRSNSSPTAVIGINTADGSAVGGATLNGIKVVFTPAVTGTFTDSDLLPLSEEGVSLYKDADGDGVFSAGIDTQVSLNPAPIWTGLSTILYPATGQDIPATLDNRNDYFVVIKTSATLSYGDAFTATIQPLGITYSAGTCGETVTTNALTADAVHLVFVDQTETGQVIDVSSDATPVIGIDLADGGAGRQLAGVRVTFTDIGGDGKFIWSDLASLGAETTSGVALYLDNKAAGTPGVFDVSDTLIPIEKPSWAGLTVTLSPSTTVDIYDDNLGNNAGSDVFVVIRTSGTIAYGDDFTAKVTAIILDDRTMIGGVDYVPTETNTIKATIATNLTDLVQSGQLIAKNSEPTEVIGINVNDGGGSVTIKSIRVRFNDAGGDLQFNPYHPSDTTKRDLLALAAAGGGVALYRDNPTAGIDGVFDSEDTIVSVSLPVWSGTTGPGPYILALAPNPSSGATVPDDDLPANGNGGADYFIVVRTSGTISTGDDFTVEIRPEDIIFSTDETTSKSIVTNIVSAKADPPTSMVVSPVDGEIITMRQRGNADLVLILDQSGSMGWGIPPPMDGLKYAANNLVDSMPNTVRIAVVQFGGETESSVLQTFTTDKTLLHNAINGLTPWDATPTSAGIREANNLFATASTQPVKRAILISDGEPTEDEQLSYDAADVSASMGVRIDTIFYASYPTWYAETFMREIARRTGGEFYSAPTAADLNVIVQSIGASIRGLIGGSAADVYYPAVINNVEIAFDDVDNLGSGGLFDPGVWYRTTRTGTNWSTWSFDFAPLSPPDGAYRIWTRASDSVGNVETAAAFITVTVDSTDPTIAISTPGNGREFTSLPSQGILIAGTADPTGQTNTAIGESPSSITKVEVSINGGGTWTFAKLAGDNLDNDNDGTEDEERKMYWADGPAGASGTYEAGTDEIFIDADGDEKYDVGEAVYEGSTPGVDTPVDSSIQYIGSEPELYPSWADDPDGGTSGVYDTGGDELFLDVNSNGIYNDGTDLNLFEGARAGYQTANGAKIYSIGNDDSDYWADDPAGTEDIYDPGIDEMFRNNGSTSQKYDGTNTVLFEGATAGIDTKYSGTILPLIDEDLRESPSPYTKKDWWYNFLPASGARYDIRVRATDTPGNTGTTATGTIISFTGYFDPLVREGQRIDATSSPAAVLGINVSDILATGRKLESITLEFSGAGFAITDLVSVSNTADSGVALYVDSGTQDGEFDADDALVPVIFPVWSGSGPYQVTLTPVTSQSLPDDDTSAGNIGDDFYIVIRTGATIDFNDEIQINVNSIKFSDGAISGSPLYTSPYPLTANIPTVYTKLTASNQTVKRSAQLAVIGINLVDRTNSGQTINALKVRVNNVGEQVEFSPSDLMPLATDGTSGIAIYKDATGAGTEGVFDSLDTVVPLSVVPSWVAAASNYYVTMSVSDPSTNVPVPSTDSVVDGTGGDDYFIVIRTSSTMKPGDDFTVQLTYDSPGDGIDNDLDGNIDEESPNLLDDDEDDLIDEDSKESSMAFSTYSPSVPTGTAGYTAETVVTDTITCATNNAPQVTLVAPAGGERWDGVRDIKWTATDADGDTLLVTLQWSLDGTNWNNIQGAVGIPNAGMYSWNTTTLLQDATTYRVKVIANDELVSTEAQSQQFTVENYNTIPVVVLHQPDPNSTSIWSGTKNITWTATDADPGDVLRIDLQYSSNSGQTWNAIPGATGIGNSGTFPWNTAGVDDGTRYRVKVIARDYTPTLIARGGTGQASSLLDFSIENDNLPPTVTLIVPDGGEIWSGTQPIRWSATDSDPGQTEKLNIKLEYSADNGATWTEIIFDGVNDGIYQWNTMALDDGANYKIRVTATDTGIPQMKAQDVSAGKFEIRNGVYSISGTVTDGTNPLQGVIVTAGTRTGTTQSDGTYTILYVRPGTYDLTPTKGGYVFTPESRQITVISADLTGQDFTGGKVGGDITGITRNASGDITITWETLAGYSYMVWYKDGFDSVFLPVVTRTAAGSSDSWTDNGTIIGIHPNNVASRFYKTTVAAGTQITGSRNTVGVYKLSLVQGMNLISLPLVPMGSTLLDVVIGSQLTGAASESAADRIWKWDNAAGIYKRAYLNASGVWVAGTPTMSPLTLSADEGAWVEIMPTHSGKNIYVIGEVATTDRATTIQEGMNLVGSSYPQAVLLDNSGLWTADPSTGAVGADNSVAADRVWAWGGERFVYAWLVDGTGTAADGKWYTGNSATTISLEPGKGYFVERRSGRGGFTWTYTKPYAQPPNY